MNIRRQSLTLLLVVGLLLTSISVASAQVGTGIPGTVTRYAFVRALPDIEAHNYGRLEPDTEVTIVARNENPRTGNATWLRVVTADGTTGWVSADSVQVAPGSDLTTLPVETIARENAAVINFVPLRSGPAMVAPSGERLGQGTLVKIEAVTPDGRWVYISAPDGLGGWVQPRGLQLTRQGAGTEPSLPDVPVIDAAVQGFVNLRVLPDIGAPSTIRLSNATPVTTISRDATADWLEVQTLDGNTGWARASDIMSVGDTAGLPEAAFDPATEGVVIDFAVLRDGPSDTAKQVGLLRSGTVVVPSMVSGNRLFVVASDGTAGWALTSTLAFLNNVAPEVPVANATTTAEGAGNVNLRAAPSVDAQHRGAIPVGGRIAVVGRNADGSWYYVVPVNRVGAWIRSDLVTLDPGVGPLLEREVEAEAAE